MSDENHMTTTYSVAIEVSKSPELVFPRLIQLSAWWPEEYVGNEVQPNATFILKTGDGHYSKNKVIVCEPNKAFSWVTTESKRKTDDFDWTGTKMIFELFSKNDGTVVQFTYDGVVLDKELGRLKEICDYCINDLLYNYLESFTISIQVTKSPHEVFEIITRDVSKWWGGRDLSGSSAKLNDEFVVHHPGTHFTKQKLIEVIPDKKLVWHVREGELHWLRNNKQEWINTKMIFEIRTNHGKTDLSFTHFGLVPQKECYETCQQGWKMVITDWLYNYIADGKVNSRLL